MPLIYRHYVNDGQFVPPAPWTCGRTLSWSGVVSRKWGSAGDLNERLEITVANILDYDHVISRLKEYNCDFAFVVFIAKVQANINLSVYSFSINVLVTDIGAVVLRLSD